MRIIMSIATYTYVYQLKDRFKGFYQQVNIFNFIKGTLTS